MRQKGRLEENFTSKFSVGEVVFHKGNTTVKMKVIRCSGMRYTCGVVSNKAKKEIVCFEDDLVSEWQIPFL